MSPPAGAMATSVAFRDTGAEGLWRIAPSPRPGKFVKRTDLRVPPASIRVQLVRTMGRSPRSVPSPHRLFGRVEAKGSREAMGGLVRAPRPFPPPSVLSFRAARRGRKLSASASDPIGTSLAPLHRVERGAPCRVRSSGRNGTGPWNPIEGSPLSESTSLDPAHCTHATVLSGREGRILRGPEIERT